ncbi:MarR family winged helix-turn-helix transcriptional regulator [Cupriavidus sp. 2TAF22]|uniref:MarR family winged helix-turn-helix transcriptional regulator n=1 Tax=unclassified Cupriavidus TaxID=2640874 RepID=UPI003F92BD50
MATTKAKAPQAAPKEEELASERLAHLVKDGARAFIRALQMRLAEHQVSYGHWVILRILWTNDGLSQRELSDLAGVTEPTTFTAVKALEALGYVERTHLPGNKKNIHVFLTRSGKALERKLVPLAEEVNDIAIQGVSAAEVAAARKVLMAVIRNLAQDETEAEGTGRRVPSTQELGRLLASL